MPELSSPEAESALLGSLILDPSCREQVRQVVSPLDFSINANRIVYQSILTLPDSFDLVILKDALLSDGKLEAAGGIDRIADFVDTVPTAAHFALYAKTIRKFSKQRHLHKLLDSAAKSVARGEELNGDLTEIIAASKEDEQADDFPMAESAVSLMAAKIPPVDYIVEPLIAAGRLTLLQGEPKKGKSCFALLVAIAAAVGQWPCGRWKVGHPRRTLFITYEDDRSLIQERINQYIAGISEPLKPLLPELLSVYCDDSAPPVMLETAEGAARLEKIIQKHKAECCVIDTFSHLTAADENSKKELQPVMNALNATARNNNCGTMVIHHTGKPSDKSQKSMVYRSRGSSAIPAAFFSILDWGNNESNVTECKLVSKRGVKQEFNVEYIPSGNDSCVQWKLSDAVDPEDKYGNRKTIIETLAKLIQGRPEGIGRSEICTETKLAKATVIGHLDALSSEGSIQSRQIKTDNGKKWVYAPITHQWPN